LLIILSFPASLYWYKQKPHRGNANGGVSKFIGVLPKPDRRADQQQHQQAKS